ncbi:hypothetical protein WA026_002074 [Henosepilachna vigintioctopunctata]|uniref:Uncharacterized protein n=1 Tax=Henosepilachna vigintioctopunctata TaxID=420089 RepID=A0AAW1TQB6_9CUCU
MIIFLKNQMINILIEYQNIHNNFSELMTADFDVLLLKTITKRLTEIQYVTEMKKNTQFSTENPPNSKFSSRSHVIEFNTIANKAVLFINHQFCIVAFFVLMFLNEH